jgi:hypothetical protein
MQCCEVVAENPSNAAANAGLKVPFTTISKVPVFTATPHALARFCPRKHPPLPAPWWHHQERMIDAFGAE